jgi:AraC-like DNA-binding protein
MTFSAQLRIEETRLPPGEEWVEETAAWRFVRVSSGAAYWLEPGRTEALTEGALLVAAPGFKAVVRASQINEVVLHAFRFVPEYLCGFFTVAERHFFEGRSAAPQESLQILPATHSLAQRFATLLARRDSGEEPVERAALLGLAVAFFSPALAKQQSSVAAGFSPRARFRQLVSQMPDLELIRHTPEQLAGLCGCTPRHFSRLFHQYFGESPRTRQTELRLQKAREMLCGGEFRISEVALDCGYRSVSLFSSLFKRRFGMSPSQWRRQATKPAGNNSSFQT